MEEKSVSRKEMLLLLADRMVVENVYQNRPYTFAIIRSWFNEKEFIGYGFSKVTYPDKWDSETGVEIAIKRSLLMIYHEIRSLERGKLRMQAWDSIKPNALTKADALPLSA